MRRLLLLLIVLARPLFGQPNVVAVTLDGAIHPITTEILRHATAQASRENAALVLVRLNTPGGFAEATRESIEVIVRSPVPVVTFVSPAGGRAASAGFFLLESGDVAAMAEGTHTGAASPILLGQTVDPVLRKKLESDTAASIRSLATRRGRNAAAAETTVFEAKSFTDREALDQRLIDLVVRDEAALFATIDGREVTRFDGRKHVLHTSGAVAAEYTPTLRERAVSAISDPNLAFLLLMAGGLLLYVEMTGPGLIAPGVAGSILVLLGLLSLSVLPISWAAVALLVLALGMFILEAKVASHGVLGLGGTVAMTLGAVMLVDGPPEVRIHLSTALAISLPFAVISVFLVTLIVKARRAPVATGTPGMRQECGVACTSIAPRGTVAIHGEYWTAQASVAVSRGTRVRVTAVDGLLLTVEPETGETERTLR